MDSVSDGGIGDPDSNLHSDYLPCERYGSSYPPRLTAIGK